MQALQLHEVPGSMIITLLNRMVALLGDASTYYKHFDQYFLLWLRMAEMDEAVRTYMCSRDYIALLANFFLGNRSPIHQHFPPVATISAQVLGPNYGPLLQAISALVGIPVVRRAVLIEDDPAAVFTHAKLSETATRALTEIFNKFASVHNNVAGMSANDINKYFNACGVYDNVTYFANRIATILKEHHTVADGRLSLQGFLSFYRDAYFKDEELVWKDLRKHGWREDLRHESEVSIEAVDEAKVIQLPALSQEVLLSEQFYEAAMNEKATTEAAQIITFICRGQAEASEKMVQALLHRVQTAPPGWKGERFVEGCVAGLASLLDLEDRLQEDRLHLAMQGPFGILSAARKLSESQGEPEIRDVYNLIKILLAINKRSKAVAQWLERQKEEWAWMEPWLRDTSLTPVLGFTPAFGRHYSKMDTLRALTEIHGGESVKRFPNNGNMPSPAESYTVTGAGSPIVNGVYQYKGEFDGVPMYTKRAEGDSQSTFTLYRCTLNSGVKRWYISDVMTGQQPGTSADIDYYWAGKEIWQGDPTPPREGWTTSKSESANDAGPADPPPTIHDTRNVRDEVI
jgi:hypothetical protein